MAKICTVKTNGFEMEYAYFGRGKRAFVILPGLGIQSILNAVDQVEDAFRFMEDDLTVFLFDKRKDIPPVYSIQDMAEDTAAAMKEAGLADVFLFGASQGGMIAMEIAIHHPELVSKLVLASTAARVGSEKRSAIESWIDLAKKKDAMALCHAFAKAIYPENVYEQSRDYFTQMAETVTDQELKRFLILAESIRGFDALSDIERIGCPILLIGAKDDEVLGSDAADEIAKRLGSRDDVTMHLYEGYGHAVFDTAPDFRPRVYAWLMNRPFDAQNL